MRPNILILMADQLNGTLFPMAPQWRCRKTIARATIVLADQTLET